MRTKYVATLKLDCRGMSPDEIVKYVKEVEARVFDKTFREFFDNNVLTTVLPVKHDTDLNILTIPGDTSVLDELLKGATRIEAPKPSDRIDPGFYNTTITWKPEDLVYSGATNTLFGPTHFYSDSSAAVPMIYNASSSVCGTAFYTNN